MRGVLVSVVAAMAVAAVGQKPIPIERSEYLAVDGARLYLEVRGADRRAPLVLWLHGGPGGAERPLFRWFDADLERNAVVAYWDQRGAGRSFDPAADPHTLTVARHLSDLAAVLAHLRATLERDRVVLVGHSWGATLALLYAAAHPDEVSAVVGVAPLVSALRAQRSQYDFVRAEAARRRDADAERGLATLGAPPYERAAVLLAVDAIAERYGAVFHRPPARVTTLIGGVFTGLVTPWEIPRFIRANDVSLDAMTPELLGLDLARTVPAVALPVVFFLGRHDRHVDATLAAAYLATLQAPRTDVVWFEESAHNVPFEEPERFVAELRRVLARTAVSAPPR